MEQFSLWLTVDEIHQIFQKAVNAIKNKKRMRPSMHEGRFDDPLSQLKAMNPAFDAIFGVKADWINHAAISTSRLNHFPTKSSDFTDTLADTISDVYELFSQDGHPLKVKLNQIKAKEISPEQKMQEIIYFFKNAIGRRWHHHVEETLKTKRHINYGQGARSDLGYVPGAKDEFGNDIGPSFDSYDDIVKRGSARNLAGATSDDDGSPQTFEPKGQAGGKPTIQSTQDEHPSDTLGDDGTVFIQAIKKELAKMVAGAGRSDRREKLQKAHDMVEDIIAMRMEDEGNRPTAGNLNRLMDKFQIAVGLSHEGRTTAMNKILLDIKAASEAALHTMGLGSLQRTVDRLKDKG